ncbi:MAG: hypothetical protein PHH04_08850, partial [Thomasclavelia sp.]|nr:hypothetical protein [Thomasclavelia sp.]
MKKIKALFSVLLCLMMICGYSVNYVSADDTEIVNETSSDITTPEEVNNEKEEENVKTENTETTNSEEETPKTETASTKEVPSAKAAGVTVNTDSATVIDLSQVEGDIYIASDGLHTGGTVTNTNFATSTYADGSLVADVNSHGYEFTGSTTTSRILVEKEITTNITLNNATISLSGYGISTHCIETSYADVTINLVGTNHLNVESQTWDSSSQRSGSIWKTGKAGTGKLTICGSGFLDASGPSNNYHTGGIIGITLYDVYIKDCTISASASYHQPAIGATCWGGNGAGNINISNAHVTAVGGYCCAAIGGGWGAPVDGIYIDNGSQVIATAGQNGSAIGSSYGYYGNGNVSNIVITGGNTKVTAYGSKVGNYPGIGTRSSSTVTNVTATPETNYQGYVKYGTSDTDYSYSTANPKTPFPTSEEFGTYLQNEAADGNPVYYTQVYFGPYKDNNDIDENAE